MDDKCVCCGAYVPEGRQVCLNCENRVRRKCPYCGSTETEMHGTAPGDYKWMLCLTCGGSWGIG